MKLVDRNWEKDRETRRRIQEDLDTSMVVEAAAGTGKTTQLIRRLVAVLATGQSTVDRIVAVTFTRKAAGELKLRLREELEQARSKASSDGETEVSERLEQAIAHLEETRIGTIHSFCAELLRQRPVEAGVDPGFQEVADDEGPRLFAKAFDRWIQDQLEIMPEGLRRALSRLAIESGFEGGVRTTPLERLRDAGWKLAEWRDFPAEWKRPPFDREPLIDRLVDLVARLASHARRASNGYDPLRKTLEPIVLLDTWIRRAGFDLVPKHPREPVGDSLPEGVLAFPTRSLSDDESDDSNPFDRAKLERQWSGSLEARDYDALEARLLALRRELKRPFNRKKGRGKYAEALPREQVVEERDLFIECLDHFRRVADADLAALLQQELRGVLPEYERVKQSEGRLDFSDLLLRTRKLLVDSHAVREELQGRISHLFIDEFQDTDPVQAEVLLLLCADDPTCNDWREVRPAPGKLFAVGDPKQSIYRFRRADVRLYEGIKRRLKDRGTAILELGRSFRSTVGIQRFVNAAFAAEMDGNAEAGRPHYLELGEHRRNLDDQPAVVALPVPKPYNWNQITQKAIEESQPVAVAAYCDWLLHQSGWKVERDGREEPIQASDICILFRRYLSWGRDVTRPYTQALEDRGITHLLIGARTFHHREEVETMRAALLAIERPGDDLAVFATLRGSLFSFSDETLLRFKAVTGGFTVFRWRRFRKKLRGNDLEERDVEGQEIEVDRDLEEVGSVLDRLLVLHYQRNRRAVVETVQEVLEFTRARAGFALRPAGHQVLANVERICDLARSYEMGGGRSFRGFVEHLEAQAAKPSSGEAPVVEDGADGVRIMTVHAAKGLEFRVVILADMTANISTSEPDHAVDAEAGLCATKLLSCSPLDLIQRAEIEGERDRAEGVRVAYVAATRARDLLVVPTVGDEPRSGWLEPLNKAIFPIDRRASTTAANCPDFGGRSVVERSERMEREAQGGEDPSVKPGLHSMGGPHLEDGPDPPKGHRQKFDVVWWDPNVLELDVRRDVGLARESLLSPREDQSKKVAGKSPGDSPAVEGNQKRYQDWSAARTAMLASGSQPSREVVAVTQIEDDPPSGLHNVEVVDLRGEDSERPSGLRFGELVHSVLRLVDLGASEKEAVEQATSLAATYSRLLLASEAEKRATVAAVRNLVTSDLGTRLRAAQAVFQELPLTAKLPVGGPAAEDGDQAGCGAGDASGDTGPQLKLVDAVIDLLLVEDGVITVIDFKTDAAPLAVERSEEQGGRPAARAGSDEGAAPPSALSLQKYQRQLSWYAELLTAGENLESLLVGLRSGEPVGFEKPRLDLLLVQI